MNHVALTHCKLVDSSTVARWTSPFVILEVSGLFCNIYFISDGNSFKQTQWGPEQTPHYVTSDLGLHFSPMAPLLVSGEELAFKQK